MLNLNAVIAVFHVTVIILDIYLLVNAKVVNFIYVCEQTLIGLCGALFEIIKVAEEMAQ